MIMKLLSAFMLMATLIGIVIGMANAAMMMKKMMKQRMMMRRNAGEMNQEM